MDFSLTDEQRLLRDSVSRFVADEHDFQTLRSMREEDGFRRAHWASFAELGWLALMVPEDDGGLGGRVDDAAIVMEEFGRGLVGAPFLSTAVLAAHIAARATAGEARSGLLQQIASGERIVALALEENQSRYHIASVMTVAASNGDGLYELTGRKIAALDGAAADCFIFSAAMPKVTGESGIGLWLLQADTPGIDIRRYRTIDGRNAADIGLDHVKLPGDALLVSPDQGETVLSEAIDRASIMLAAEALGAMEAAMAMTAEYLRTRQQFRRPLSDFQVLTHRLSDMFVNTENARSMVYRGLSLLEASPDKRAAAVSATMVAVLQASEFVCANAIQLHGGIGMAEETSVGHYYKRIRAIGKSYGDLHFHMSRYATLLKK